MSLGLTVRGLHRHGLEESSLGEKERGGGRETDHGGLERGRGREKSKRVFNCEE